MAEASATERVLVTGASGFIATHIIKQLQEKGYQVRGTVRSLENEKKIKHLKELVPDAAHPVELVETDLTKEDGWKSAVEGCMYVVHTASPLPVRSPEDENDIITPAVEGVKNVLKACKEAKCVKRLVLTSAGLAIIGFMKGGEFTEKDWPENEDELDAYAKSKLKAEKEAWEFVKNLEDGDKFELAVIHPTAVLGPVLHNQMGTSMEILKRILERNPPMIPKLNIPAVDVRDVAKAHVVAMTLPEAAGNRHIVSTDNIWWSEMAAHVAEEFKPQGYKIASVACPKIAIQLTSVFDKNVKAILPNWNKITKLDNTRMKEVLKIEEPIDLKTSVIDMAYSMIEGGFVKKTSKYRGRNWREIFEKEKAEKEQAKAEKVATRKASKKIKKESKKENGGAEVVKENGEATVEDGAEKKDEAKEGEEKKEEETKAAAADGEKGEEKEEAKGEEEKKDESEGEKKEEEKEQTEEEKKEEKKEETKEEEKEAEEEKKEAETTKEEESKEEAAKEEETPATEEAAAETTEKEEEKEKEEKPAEESAPAESEDKKEDEEPAVEPAKEENDEDAKEEGDETAAEKQDS